MEEILSESHYVGECVQGRVSREEVGPKSTQEVVEGSKRLQIGSNLEDD